MKEKKPRIRRVGMVLKEWLATNCVEGEKLEVTYSSTVFVIRKISMTVEFKFKRKK